MPAPASAGSVTLTTSEVNLFYDDNGCTTFEVTVASGGGDGLINVRGLHESGEFFTVPAGESRAFRLSNLGIRRVTGKSSTGTAAITFGVLAKTVSS